MSDIDQLAEQFGRMGKQKTRITPYYYFILETKDKHESLRQAFQEYKDTWKSMTQEQKAPYEQRAKEEKEKRDLMGTDKYTVTGESFAQVERRQMEQRSLNEQMEKFISQLTSGPEAGDRMFIFMKAVHSVEEIIDRTEKIYWPSELSMATFSLNGGIKRVYTQLVDTEEYPTGYASQACENCEENGLPMPGDRSVFDDDCRDYSKIMKNIYGFADRWLKNGYEKRGHEKVFFALDSEIEPIMSCLQWLVNQLSGKEREKYQDFIDNLKIYKISKLVLGLAVEAGRNNPTYRYQSTLLRCKVDTAADEVVLKGNYDYREEIVCGYHLSDAANMKMHFCAQSIIMRRIFSLFDEILPAFNIQRTKRHDVKLFGRGIKAAVTKKKSYLSAEWEEMAREEPSWLQAGKKEPEQRDIESFKDDDFPNLHAAGGLSSGSRGASGGWSLISSSRSTSRPSGQYSGIGGGGRRGGGGGGGQRRSNSSYMDEEKEDDFPSLSASSSTRGRGRGRRN